MDPEGVKFSHIHAKDRGLFFFRQFITFDEGGGILAKAFALGRIAINMVNQFL